VSGRVPVRRALLSVSDKTGLVELARVLAELGVELISTGGTHAHLRAAGLAVREVSDVTGFPEIMDGRVKTLHPRIHGGLLGRAGTDDAVMVEHGIAPIDLVVVNLYPFTATIAKPGVTDAEAIENIDIGGPAMTRAAAKNHARVLIVTNPADYAEVAAALQDAGGSDFTLRRRLAAKAYAHTSAYDAAVAAYLARQS
jgi:phosphoribosylaminoimidazolecarboxamide formyltransferase/IMP cyclohydrolase